MKKKLLFSVFILLCCIRSLGQVEAHQPNDINQCNYEVFDLTVQTPVILGNLNPNEYQVSYFITGSDAENNVNPIANPWQFVPQGNTQMVFARVTNNALTSLYGITQFAVHWDMTPVLTPFPDVTACDVYTLPPLQVPGANYYWDASHTVPIVQANITQSTVVYIYVENGFCSSQESFNVNILSAPAVTPVNVTVCGEYILPPLQFGQYYTGPFGTGTTIPPGVAITSTTTLYVYAGNGNCTSDQGFTITVLQPPVIVNQPESNIIICPDSSLMLTADAEGANLIYQWYYNAQAIPGATTNSINIIEPGTYYFTVSNGMCLTDGNFINVSYETPQIDVNPSLGQICPGTPYVVSIGQTGLEESFVWYVDGVLVPSVTGPDFAAEGSNVPHTYECIVTGTSCGVPESATITVTPGTPAVFLEPMTSCFENGVATFDLTTVNLGENVPATFAFYTSEFDAMVQANPINTGTLSAYTVTQEYSYVWARVDNIQGICPVSISIIELIAQECTGNTISGVIRFDGDNNGCTDNDGPVSGIEVVNIHNNDISYAYTNANGEYTFTNVANGNNFVALSTIPLQYTAPVPTGSNYVMEGNTVVTKNFCLSAAQPVTDAVIYFYPMSNARPGFSVSYMMYVFNAGTLNLSGNASLTYDVSKLDFNAASPVQTSQISNTLNFYFNDLAPSQYQAYYISFTVKVPPIVNLGDIISFHANMDTVNTDAHPYDNTLELSQVAVNSYDPNEIVVQQGPQILETQVTEDLNYTIHFQNTGNADAINVRLEADLDDKLDWTTFRPVASTHNYTSERVGNHIVFKFDNINLPGSLVDEPGSNGYITYKVKPKATLALGDIIEADADIYFDFNLPIATNTVMTELVTILNTNHNDFSNLELYPNPARGKVNIRFNENVNDETTINVFDMQGKTVLSHSGKITGNEASLTVSKLQTGIYFVKIISGNKTAVRKLVVK
ncbi:DUF7619 domain-containing protein [Flavobacterium pallidum]|uniref:Uncharacterized protein n=1 Tax=Flavobacterium pallidum TaxID=2172098 RepID=A0A2S1SET3_9FLAO|nr:T9SS type A sorting domain-containing protein [Flavobacterium pallidum]AWI24875.1 hypothetical protein HYN49_02635 [Flavobacterium pallidum]